MSVENEDIPRERAVVIKVFVQFSLFFVTVLHTSAVRTTTCMIKNVNFIESVNQDTILIH